VRLGTPSAILLGFILLAAAVVLEGRLNPNPRYSLTSSGTGLLIRLDTRNGEAVACLPGSDDSSQKIVVSCTGMQP
jgi:hypothetical protein